ncbi:MAG: hypothetical protein MZV64_70830 [Ignavibacteriales bacterium]|nr:hypothetical protein [Ignavibacteriales bacterium]
MSLPGADHVGLLHGELHDHVGLARDGGDHRGVAAGVGDVPGLHAQYALLEDLERRCGRRSPTPAEATATCPGFSFIIRTRSGERPWPGSPPSRR